MPLSYDIVPLFCLLGSLIFTSSTEGQSVYYIYPCTNNAEQVNVSSQNYPVNDCKGLDLTSFLQSLNQNHSNVDINIAAGTYRLVSSNINVTYSLSIMAAFGDDVVLLCSDNEHKGDETGTQIGFGPQQILNKGNITFENIVFQQCPYSLKFDNLENLLIENCTFRNFKAPAVDVLNTVNITVINSHFIENNVTSLNDRYRADAPGLCVSYKFEREPDSYPTLMVQGCEFEGNQAKISDTLLAQQTSQVLNENYYPARGGALSVIITESMTNISASVVDCLFIKNEAQSFGGAIYIALDGSNTTHSMVVSNTQFIGNKCSEGGGGAIFLGYLKREADSDPSVFKFSDCNFVNNSGNSGGGILAVQTRVNGSHDYMIVQRSNFIRNEAKQGSAIVFGSLYNVKSQGLIQPSQLEDSFFMENESPGGTVVAGFTHIDTIGNNTFLNNIGTAFQVIGCLVRQKGNLSFIGNSNQIAGGATMHLSAFAQIMLHKNTNISFINNNGTLGAAMKIDLQQFPNVYSNFLSNPLCFLLYENQDMPPLEWDPELIHFSGNKASIGSAIYASYLNLCSFYSNNKTDIKNIFNINQFPNWPVFHFDVNNNTSHEDHTNRRYYIQTPALTIDNRTFNNYTLDLRPGEVKTIQITGLDQFNNPTYFVVRILDEDKSLGSTLSKLFDVNSSFQPPENYSKVYQQKDIFTAQFNPGLIPVYPNKSINITYGLELPSSLRPGKAEKDYTSVIKTQHKHVLLQVQTNDGINSNYINISLKIQPCLPGYELQPTSDNNNIIKCICTGAKDDPFSVLDCKDDETAVILRNGYWAGKVNEGANNLKAPNLITYTCPITYCQCLSNNDTNNCVTAYNYNDPNEQCHPPRYGTLCGSCGSNATVTVLRMQCQDDCDNGIFFIATAILVFMDVVIIVVVLLVSMKLSIPLPHSLRAVLFYVQTVYITTEYFPISFWDSRQYMLYLGNLMGLYFPVDFCFLSDVPSVLVFLPRFIPPLLVFIIPIFFIFSQRGKRGMWHGVWSLVQLTYVPLCYTCIALLHCPVLPKNDGNENVMRWFLNADIKCFNDVSHIILGLMAIIFLLGLIGLIPVIILLVLFEKHSFIQEKHPLLINVVEALKAGYRPNWKWWGGMELFRRILLISIAIGLPGRTVAPLYVLAFLFVLHVYIRPYKYTIQNFIEAIVLLDYTVLFIFRFPQTLLDSLEQYSGTSIPSIYKSDLPPNDSITYFFWPFFYLPVIIGAGVCVTWIVYKTWSRVNKMRELEEDDKKEHIPMTTDFDHYYDHEAVGTEVNSIVSFTDIEDLIESKH